jgi:hypothetical protein
MARSSAVRPGHPVQHVPDDRLRVPDRRQRRGQRPLGVVGDDAAHQHPDRPRVGERIEPATPDELADLAVHDVHSGRHGTPVESGRSVDKSSGL